MSSIEERREVAEDNVKNSAEEMGRVKMQFDREMSTLRADYDAKIRALRVSIHGTVHANHYLEREINWKETVLERARKSGDSFNERDSLVRERQVEMQRSRDAFNESVDALELVSSNDMAVLRSYTHPPPLVWTTLEAILEVNGEWNTTWEEAQVVLSDNYFFNFFVRRARKFDLENNVSDDMLNDLEDNMQDPDFTPAVVAQVSTPCQAFCKFVRAVYDYARVYRITQPCGLGVGELQDQLAELKSKLYNQKESIKDTEKRLEGVMLEMQQRKQDMRRRFDGKLEEMQDSFVDAHMHYNSLLSTSA